MKPQCIVVGGGPAGMMLGYLLARAGVETVVLEKHADFLRDFRGDTVHPSTLRILDELGLLDAFLRLPHQKLRRLVGEFGSETIAIGDFSGLPERYAYIAFMPQWDFLDFIAAEGRKLPKLQVRMQARVDSLIEEGGRVAGVRGMQAAADGSESAFELRAPLVVGCDGRHSTVRAAARLPLDDIGAPIDVMWFRIGRDPSDGNEVFARMSPGHFIVTIDRGDYWQCAFVIAKGGAEALRARGLEAFRAEVVQAAPMLASHIAGVVTWDDVKLLAVSVDRLREWSRPGLLCIGDAAHAMSPIGGVGINLAVQDAVATANLLATKLRTGSLADADLDAVRARRLFPTRATQAMQLRIQTNVLQPAISQAGREVEAPLLFRIIGKLPWLQRVLARVLGMGVRPEHVQSEAAP